MPSTLGPAFLNRKRADGSFANDVTTMRQDDPILSTALALEALVRCR